MQNPFLLMLGFVSAWIFSPAVWAADCVPDSMLLVQQAQIDNFQLEHGPCDSVVGDLSILGPPGGITGDIVNLDGLSGLTRAGYVQISSLKYLTEVGGLSALTHIDNSLRVEYNPKLADLDGLAALSSVGGAIRIGANPELGSISGLSGLSGNLGGLLNVWNNPALVSLDGLSKISSVGGYLNIVNNDSLVSVAELGALTSVGGSLRIIDNSGLMNLAGLSSLASVGLDLHIETNPLLQTLNGLSGLLSVGATVRIQSNASLFACHDVYRLLDDVDDALSGPGPGPAGIPDVGGDLITGSNLHGCNQRSEVLEAGPPPMFLSGFE